MRVEELQYNERNLTELEDLVRELSKNTPREEKIEKLMASLGIQYSSDPIERLESVLQAVSFSHSSLDLKE